MPQLIAPPPTRNSVKIPSNLFFFMHGRSSFFAVRKLERAKDSVLILAQNFRVDKLFDFNLNSSIIVKVKASSIKDDK